MKQDISNEIEKIINYCKSKECDECKYRANDDLCNLHNPTAWNVINEKQAIEKLKFFNEGDYITRDMAESKDIILNLIEKQQAEIEKNDKTMNLMADQMAGLTIFDIEKDEPLILGNKEDVIEYFNKKILTKI